jgi:hypothetical protein
MAEGIKNQFVGMLFVNIGESESRKNEINCQLFSEMLAKSE